MKNRWIRLIWLLSVVAIFASVGYAHEGREVGDYTIVFGWRVEPAYTGLMNGPEITVTRHTANESEAATEEADNDEDEADDEDSSGVTGLEDTLQIEVSFGPATRILNLRTVRGEPGHYIADLIPMRPGDYSFRVFGTIEGTEVNETFSSADGEFSSVEPIEDIQFP